MGWIPYPGALRVPLYGLQSGGGAPGGLGSGQPMQTVGSVQMPMASAPSAQMLAQLLRNPNGTSAAPAAAPAQTSTDPSSAPGGDPFAAARAAVAQHMGAPMGQAQGGGGASMSRKSDRRLKSEVSRIGTLPNGLAVYRYRLQGGPFEIGCMADEVLSLHPGAVWEAEDGFLRVEYSKAVL